MNPHIKSKLTIVNLDLTQSSWKGFKFEMVEASVPSGS